MFFSPVMNTRFKIIWDCYHVCVKQKYEVQTVGANESSIDISQTRVNREVLQRILSWNLQYDPNASMLNCGQYWTLVNMKVSYCLLRYGAVWSGRALLKFCRNVLHPSSWYSQDGNTSFLQNIMLYQTTWHNIPELILWSICLVSIMKSPFNVSLWSEDLNTNLRKILYGGNVNSNCWLVITEIKR
jgi:hypothetical protein